MFSRRIGQALRFVLVSFALAITYLLLQHLWLGLAELGIGWQARLAQPDLARDAAAVAARSQGPEAQLPAAWRAGVFRLGWLLGQLAESAPLAGGEARRASLQAEAGKLAAAMGLGPAAWPASATADEFARLQARFEDDESGLGQRVETRLSLRHRHLYLAGVHAGINHAVLRASGGSLFNGQSAALFVRHASLAGWPPDTWLALTRAPDGATPALRVAGFEAALSRFDAALAAGIP